MTLRLALIVAALLAVLGFILATLNDTPADWLNSRPHGLTEPLYERNAP